MLYIENIILTQGTYGSPETPPLKENNLMLT
jgi:hypothetical protein